MRKDNVVGLETKDHLTEILREGARGMLAVAVEQEAKEFIASHSSCLTEAGISRFVRNGFLPERTIQTGIGNVEVKMPRVRDRASDGNKIKYSSSLIPPYLKRSQSLEEFLPLLYLKGLSTNDFAEALTPIFGKQAKNLSPGVICRLKSKWQTECAEWQKRSLSGKHYVYWWVDGIYFQARMEDGKDCVLVVMGVTEKGRKELIAIQDGYRESKQSWLELLTSLKERGLTKAPKVAVGDGAMGFWSAFSEAYPNSKQQRCWVHKTANILNKLPKSLQGQAKEDIHEIWMSATKKAANQAFDRFLKKYAAKYPKATDCLSKDRDALMTFYDFPAEHWKHLRTTNPIESTFSTVRHRTYKAKGCFSRATVLSMVFKLCCSAEKRWNRLCGFSYLADVIEGVKFVDGVKREEESVGQGSIVLSAIHNI